MSILNSNSVHDQQTKNNRNSMSNTSLSSAAELLKNKTLAEDYRKLKDNLSKSITVVPCRRDYIFDSQWETLLSYEDPSIDIMTGYLILRHDDPSTSTETSLICEFRLNKSIIPVINLYEKKNQEQSLGIHLVQWAETIARKEHDSLQLAAHATNDNNMFFKNLGYVLGPRYYLYKSLLPSEYISAFDCTDGPKLAFTENLNIITNVLNPDAAEDEWLKNFDEDYRNH